MAHEHHLSQGTIVMFEEDSTICDRWSYSCHPSLPPFVMPLGGTSMMELVM